MAAPAAPAAPARALRAEHWAHVLRRTPAADQPALAAALAEAARGMRLWSRVVVRLARLATFADGEPLVHATPARDGYAIFAKGAAPFATTRRMFVHHYATACALAAAALDAPPRNVVSMLSFGAALAAAVPLHNCVTLEDGSAAWLASRVMHHVPPQVGAAGVREAALIHARLYVGMRLGRRPGRRWTKVPAHEALGPLPPGDDGRRGLARSVSAQW